MTDHELSAAELDGCGAAWPIRCADLAPHYAHVDARLGVDALVSSAPCSGAEMLERALAEKFPGRRVLPWRLARGMLIGDSDAPLQQIRSALATGHVEVRPNTIARSVLVDGRGRGRGVVCIDRRTGVEREIKARAVVLCASTIESVRLLLNTQRCNASADVDGSGCLGRFFMDHLSGVRVEGMVPGMSGYAEREDPLCGLVYVPCFRNIGEKHPEFLRGYQVQGAITPYVFERDVRELPGDFAANLADVRASCSMARFYLSALGEVLPRADNEIALDPTVTDAWGIPVPRIQLRYGDNELAMARDMRRELRAMTDAAGFDVHAETEAPLTPGSSIHEVGGARMGTDPKTSVLGPFNEVWKLPNVFVTDGACFPSGGHQNPTLTMMALTVRACERIAERWRSHTL